MQQGCDVAPWIWLLAEQIAAALIKTVCSCGRLLTAAAGAADAVGRGRKKMKAEKKKGKGKGRQEERWSGELSRAGLPVSAAPRLGRWRAD